MVFKRLDGILAETFERLGIEDAEGGAADESAPAPGLRVSDPNELTAADAQGGERQPPLRAHSATRNEKGTPTGAGAKLEEHYQTEGGPVIATILPNIGRDMATARTGAEPHGSAVVISLAIERAKRHAALRWPDRMASTP